MTRCRCAECGAVLAVDQELHMKGPYVELLVHPCGACLQEAKVDAVAQYVECLDEQVLLEQEGRD